MKLSFDLDGVIADTDNAMLGLLYNARTNNWAGAVADLEQYYVRQRILIDPREFLGAGDYFHIVTGRVPSAQGLTKLWVERWFGWRAASPERLHFVSDEEIERQLCAGEDAAAYEELARRKLAMIQSIGAAVHFDNNPTIVRLLRRGGVAAVMVGGGLL